MNIQPNRGGITVFQRSTSHQPPRQVNGVVMEDLDYYALGQFFGAKIVPIKAPVFGHFGLLEVTSEAAKALYTPHKAKPQFTLNQDKLITQSFEDSREDLPPDALLWDADLAKRFTKSCRKKGLDFPQSDLVRRLLNIRKNAKKYASHGIVLKATTQRIHFDALSECTPAVEFSLVRLRYRHGVSIDEILIDPILGMEFERTTAEFLPNISSRVMRQAALAVRKTRALHQITLSDLTNLRANRLEPWWSQFQPIAFLNLTEIPKSAGLMEVRESSRELYISRNENLRGAVNVLFERHAISIMENPFWKPDLSKIEIRYISETSMGPTELKRWELKLLCEQSPVFNWPPKKPKRAA